MLEDIYNDFRTLAEEIEWKKYDKNDLFFNYLKYKTSDADLAEKFYAGIVCRYWGYTGILYTKCNKNIPFEECYDILIDTINYLLDKHVWTNPSSSLYNDPKGPEKAFHFVIKRQLAVTLARKSADKRKADFKALSIDDIHEKYNDSAEGLFDLVSGSESTFNIYTYIQGQENSFSKIVLDQVCFSGLLKPAIIAKKLKELDIRSYAYYNEAYQISDYEYEQVINLIKSLTISNLTKEVKKVLYKARKDWVG